MSPLTLLVGNGGLIKREGVRIKEGILLEGAGAWEN